jgi:prevent-host-death family protein
VSISFFFRTDSHELSNGPAQPALLRGDRRAGISGERPNSFCSMVAMRAPMPAMARLNDPTVLHWWPHVAILPHMISAGIRELKNNLSHYVRQIEAGKRIAVTAHGRVVAELVPPTKGERVRSASRYDELVAAGIIEPAIEPRALPPKWPDIRLGPGTAGELINSDRGEP